MPFVLIFARADSRHVIPRVAAERLASKLGANRSGPSPDSARLSTQRLLAANAEATVSFRDTAPLTGHARFPHDQAPVLRSQPRI
ncbi:hypothetical protein DF3PA_30089 [Candidatus Defluviicoccus seviourii]|uniref:Uncharacterized protein n=2 Tax=root TaxID=1 RepID=A0A564WF03_9PROT|nr:hypothetical protein DF3PB_820006 [uncultured Defluviicoccus sp.]VUX46861.1 hypothetical protein DF3PA_30089 [Candidatus Defluviicoccus seviourii]